MQVCDSFCFSVFKPQPSSRRGGTTADTLQGRHHRSQTCPVQELSPRVLSGTGPTSATLKFADGERVLSNSVML